MTNKTSPPPLFDLRLLVLLIAGVLAAAVVGLLTLKALDNPWAATLAALAAAAGTMDRLNCWTTR
jgi:CBS-domain-containing membrane protein